MCERKLIIKSRTLKLSTPFVYAIFFFVLFVRANTSGHLKLIAFYSVPSLFCVRIQMAYFCVEKDRKRQQQPCNAKGNALSHCLLNTTYYTRNAKECTMSKCLRVSLIFSVFFYFSFSVWWSIHTYSYQFEIIEWKKKMVCARMCFVYHDG